MSKHTPGPWKLSKKVHDPLSGRKHVYKTVLTEDRDIATLVSGAASVMNANAHLIAAAPVTKQERDELLEACQFVLELIKAEVQVSTFWDDPEAHWNDSISSLETAIAKATGTEGK